MFIRQAGKSLLAVIVTGAILSGCATNPDGTTNDRQQTVAEGAVVGAVLGGLLGAAVTNKGSGALVGAAAGGIIGAGIGSSVADRKAQYAREEDFLVAEIQRNQEFIEEADAQNRQLYREIAQLDRESQRLAREYRAGKVTRDALASQKASLEKQLAKAKQVNSLAEKQLADADQVYQESRQQRGPQDKYTQQLESNVVKLKETRQQSQQNVASLEKVYDSMSI
jgi:uncharacterized protein (DUF1501 family)